MTRKALILYQIGRHDKTMQEKAIMDFCRGVEATGQWECVRLEREFTNRGFGFFQREFVDRIDNDEFACSVGFFFPDARLPSTAGNVALEVGTWLGRKGDHELLILCFQGAHPSQINGEIKSHEVATVDEALKRFDQFQLSIGGGE